MSKNAKPDYFERCKFAQAWVYSKQGEDKEVLVVEQSINLTRDNPMQGVDFYYAAATSNKHHTFVGHVVEFSGFFMN